MREETIGITRAWSAKDSAQEQTWQQNDADDRFEHTCELAKMLGTQHTPPRRFMDTTKDEDGTPRFTYYRIYAMIAGTTEAVEYFKAMLDGTSHRPVQARDYMLTGEYGTPIVVRCCSCPHAFTVGAAYYHNTPRHIVERPVYCPHCRTRIAEYTELAVIPTSEEQEKHIEQLKAVQSRATQSTGGQ